MKKQLFIYILLATGIFTSCHISPQQQKAVKIPNNDGLLMATLYMQRASEYKALCYQAYNSAAFQLDEKIKNHQGNKKLAVVVDIDETVLDNSPFTARSIIENTNYPTYWKEWCEKSEAKPIPGALDFLTYAASKDVETFYISNRKVTLTEATLINLQKDGFPYADSLHILLRTNTSDKEPRRNIVRENHDILLLCGDNLGDFISDFDVKDNSKRSELTFQNKNKFGEEYIVLPNPTYGVWMNALLKGSTKDVDADSVYKSRLINF